ncbi:hypothetical protein DERF_015935 [Dermatophagoides farinae]|uniref:Uncharacterized protein n=1 Tax=Dermatophagoides farinae TaxID=6954 RepID=A0A922HN16_DERFA|nr:hypothetical protein DERF_015935 [Dermatophagoides farinae]
MKSIFLFVSLFLIIGGGDALPSSPSSSSSASSISAGKRQLLIQIIQSLAHKANESGLTGDQTIFETAAQLLQTKGATDDDETQILSFLQLQLMGQMLKKPSKLFK